MDKKEKCQKELGMYSTSFSCMIVEEAQKGLGGVGFKNVKAVPVKNTSEVAMKGISNQLSCGQKWKAIVDGLVL